MSSTRTIDLNADLGEGCPWDEPLLARVTSASICCGAHAGDPEAIRRTLQLARARGVTVGAHPGYPDREHFGRKERPASAEEVRQLIEHQVGDLAALAATEGLTIRLLKPHGALYNQAQREPSIAGGVIAAARSLGLPLLGLPGSLLHQEADRSGVPYLSEGFADRRYRPDGSLTPRTEPGAVLDDPAEIKAQVLRLVEEGRVATLCLHGDNPHSVALADLVRSTLSEAGITWASPPWPSA